MIALRTPLLSLILLLSAGGAGSQLPRVGIIDFYGVHAVRVAALRQALGLREGDSIVVDGIGDLSQRVVRKQADLLARIKRVTGVRDAAIAIVCCDESSKTIVYVGVRDQDAPAVAWDPPPTGTVRFPAAITKLSQDLDNAILPCVEKGDAGEDESLGYSVINCAPARAIQQKLIAWAPAHGAQVRDVLHHAKDPQERQLAATLVAYLPDRANVVVELATAVRDADPEVRNAAMRALSVMAEYAQVHSDAHLVVPFTGFVTALSSLDWTDRNKAAFGLVPLTESRDPKLLAELRARAMEPLSDMARWKSFGHAEPALVVLRRMAGMADEDAAALQQEDREAIIVAAQKAQQAPHATSQHGAFAFPDANGTRLLAPEDLPRPEILHTALCSNGGRVPVKFDRRQSASDGSTGRQSPANFDKLAGTVFTVIQGKLDASATCFIATDSLLSSATLLSAALAADSGRCNPDLQRRISSARSRGVTNCWLVAHLPEDKRLTLVEFARSGKDALASVAFTDVNRTIFADYPALYHGPGQDLWRVDDGGALSPDGFQVVFLLQRGSFHALGVSWSGSEGRSLALFVSNGNSPYTRAIDDYWYRAPL